MATEDEGLKCPYNQCGKCLYVGKGVQMGKACPVCETVPQGILTVWPQMQWVNAPDDISFLCHHKKLELLTIAAAAYFEGLLQTFLEDGMWFIYEPTRIAERCECPSIQDCGERFLAGNRELKRRDAKQKELFDKYRHRTGKQGRMDGLCNKLYGDTFDDLLAKHCGDVAVFVANRDNIAAWRNVLLHRGASLDHIWPDDLRQKIPGIVQGFVRQCWEVFRTLYNQLIHKLWWAEHSP